MIKTALSLIVVSFSLICQAQTIRAYDYTTVKKVIATKGAVVSAHPLASEVGLQFLK
jgi:gamma-glutamyltranspeptidase